MEQNFREHYSQNFRLNIDELPASATDRLSLPVLFFAFLGGIFYVLIGLFFLNLTSLNGITDLETRITQTNLSAYRLLSNETFGIILFILGIGIILCSVFYSIRSKKISFDGTTVTVKDHPVFGKPHSFVEDISAFSGVRLRSIFCQYGIFSRNKFIIELYHKDHKKIIPLYISTNPKRIRSIWREYALKLHLVPIHISEKGMVSHSVKDIDRSFAEVVKQWNLPKDFLLNKKHSMNFVCKQKQDKKMIKTRQVILDLYSTLNILAVLLLGSVLSYAFFNHDIIVQYIPSNIVLILYALTLTLIVYAYLTLVVRDAILIHNQKIVVFRKILGFVFQDSIIKFTDLKSIDIFFTPTTGRYALNLVTDKHITTVFNKFTPEDLRWIRGFIISEIIE